MRLTSVLVMVLLLGGGARLALGSLIASDSFESYTSGTQLSGQNGGTGFDAGYAVTAALVSNVTVTSPGLSYSGGFITVNGGNRAARVTGAADSNNLVTRSFAAQSGNPIYFSFLYSTSSASTEAFLQFGLESGNAAEPNASVGVQGMNGNSANADAFFVRVPNGGNSAFSQTALNSNQTYFAVGRISRGTGSSTYNVVDLFLNPTNVDESSPTLTASSTAGSGVASFDNFVLRTARTDAGVTYTFDQLTIGTTYLDVVPEPSMLSVAGLAILGLRRRRRRV